MAKPKLKAHRKAQQTVDEARSVRKSVMDSAQQIWLAGLGAFAKAQEEGGKLFDNLVKKGSVLDAKTREFTEGKVNEARGTVESTLGQVRERGQETWDKLERVFEDRVSRSLGRLGIPSREELQALKARVDDLAREVRKPAARKAPATKSAGVKKAAGKRTSKS